MTRDAFASVPPLEVTAVERLVAWAVARGTAEVVELPARRTRLSHVVVGAGSIAAAILVVLLGVAAMRSSNRTTEKSTRALAVTRAPAQGTGSRQNKPTRRASFGNADQAQTLLARVRDQLLARGIAVEPPVAKTERSTAPGTHPTSTDASGSPTGTEDPLRCVATARRRYDLASDPVLTGTETLRGLRVDALVFASHLAYVTYVMLHADCSTVIKLDFALP